MLLIWYYLMHVFEHVKNISEFHYIYCSLNVFKIPSTARSAFEFFCVSLYFICINVCITFILFYFLLMRIWFLLQIVSVKFSIIKKGLKFYFILHNFHWKTYVKVLLYLWGIYNINIIMHLFFTIVTTKNKPYFITKNL